MTYETPTSAAQIAEMMIAEIDQPGVAYNCRCQVGGVDAVSIDTDWLLHNLRSIRDFPDGAPAYLRPVDAAELAAGESQ